MKLKIEALNPLIKIEFEDFSVDNIEKILDALSGWEKVRSETLGLSLLSKSPMGVNRLVDEGNPAPASSFAGDDIHGSGGKFVSSFLPDIEGKKE